MLIHSIFFLNANSGGIFLCSQREFSLSLDIVGSTRTDTDTFGFVTSNSMLGDWDGLNIMNNLK